MPDAYIFDAVRTPRGKGRKDGALHGVTSLDLATQVLVALRDRNDLDTGAVDDVVLGCVNPLASQGADIARVAVLNADYAETVAGVQVNRFCASGLEACNIAAAKVMSGEAELAIGGGVESMSRVPMFSDMGAWSADPTPAFKTYFAARDRRRPDLRARRLHPRRCRRLCGREPAARRAVVGRGALRSLDGAGQGRARADPARP